MKKLFLLFVSLFAFTALHAQWVNDPANNTFIANTSADAGEIYLATDPGSGDTYVQWSQFESNGWVPKVQRLNFEGEPQWDADGLQPASQHTLASWSQGIAMAATTDNAVVSCFSTEAGHSAAVKINADGTYPWGEAGVLLFNGAGGSRTELLAGNDGGVWTLGTDYDYTYLQYVSANGTLGQLITIGDGSRNHDFGLMVPGPNNSVLVVYEKQQWAYTYYYENELWVVGFTVDGTQIGPETQLMGPYTMGGSYCHYVVPDGMGGGYAFMWHAGIMDAFNTYVFHFDQYGNSTISDLNGCPVHATDPSNYYLDAYGTVDPISHDLIIAYEQTDASTQSQSRIYVNRITPRGEKVWGDGLLVADYFGDTYTDILVDAFEDGSGFTIICNKGNYNSTVEAKGFDMNGNPLWSKQMSTNSYPRYMCDNSTGFHLGQNVVTWVNSNTGGLYGQNIGLSGEMGEITPPTPPSPCLAPTNLQGEYFYSDVMFGAMLSWDAPETLPLHYNLYCDELKDIIVIDAEYSSYFQEMEVGDYTFRLTAVYEDCESDYALTATGDNYVLIEVTSVPENADEEIVTVTKIYTLNGQMIRNANLEELSRGIYIVQSLTRNGQLVTMRIVRN